jgi:hypothetical protein
LIPLAVSLSGNYGEWALVISGLLLIGSLARLNLGAALRRSTKRVCHMTRE